MQIMKQEKNDGTDKPCRIKVALFLLQLTMLARDNF